MNATWTYRWWVNIDLVPVLGLVPSKNMLCEIVMTGVLSKPVANEKAKFVYFHQVRFLDTILDSCDTSLLEGGRDLPHRDNPDFIKTPWASLINLIHHFMWHVIVHLHVFLEVWVRETLHPFMWLLLPIPIDITISLISLSKEGYTFCRLVSTAEHVKNVTGTA